MRIKMIRSDVLKKFFMINFLIIRNTNIPVCAWHSTDRNVCVTLVVQPRFHIQSIPKTIPHQIKRQHHQHNC